MMYTGWEKFMFAYHRENNPPTTPTEVLKATSQWWAGHLFFSTRVVGRLLFPNIVMTTENDCVSPPITAQPMGFCHTTTLSSQYYTMIWEYSI